MTDAQKKYNIEDKDEYIIFTSKDYRSNTRRSDGLVCGGFDTTSESDINYTRDSSRQVFPVHIGGTGKLYVGGWDFLNRIEFPARLQIRKYVFVDSPAYSLDDDGAIFQVFCEYISDVVDTNKADKLAEAVKKNISYKSLNLDEFKEVYNKLCKNGTDEKLTGLIEKYIAMQKDISEREFLYRVFEPYFEKSAKLKARATDLDELLGLEITSLYKQKELFFDHPNIVARLQKKLLYVLIQYFQKIKDFSPRLNTSGLYIREFLDIRYLDIFEESGDRKWIQKYERLMESTVDSEFSLCNFIINLELDSRLKIKYLSEQIGCLNGVLENHNSLDGEAMLDNYHEIKFKSKRSDLENSKLDLVNMKIELIKRQDKYLRERQLGLFYLVLYKIDRGELQKELFEVALHLYKSLDEDGNGVYYKSGKIDQLDWLNYDDSRSGAQEIVSFNYNRYRLLMSLYNYQLTGIIDIKYFEKENFTEEARTFEKELNAITADFVSKYFDCAKDKFDKFTKLVREEIKNKTTSIVNEEAAYIAKTPIKKEYETRFKDDCENVWASNQKNLSGILLLEEPEGGQNIKPFFTQQLFEKRWFLDSFYKNVGLSRDYGRAFGRNHIGSKVEYILTEINKTFSTQHDKEIVIKDILSDLANEIQPNNKEGYILFCSSTLWIELHKIPNIKHVSRGFATANFDLNNSTILLCFSRNSENLLFEKDAFVLKQYAKSYDGGKKLLVVDVRPIEKEEEIQQILKTYNVFKSADEVKKMVWISMTEKFEIKRTEKTRLIRLKMGS